MEEFPVKLQAQWTYEPTGPEINYWLLGVIFLVIGIAIALFILYNKKIIHFKFSGNIKKLLLVVGVIAIVAVLVFSGVFSGIVGLFANDYDTGLSLTTEAVFDELKKDNYDPNKGYVYIKGAGREVFVKDKYICSWQPGEYSQLITMRADFMYNPMAQCEGWGCALGIEESVTLSRYYVTVDYIDTSGKETRIVDTHDGVNAQGDMWDTNYVEMIKERIPPDERYITGGHLLPNAVYSDIDFVKNDPVRKWIERDETGEDKSYHPMQTDTFEFHMKGLRVGALRVDYYIESAMRHNFALGWEWVYHGWEHFATDEVYLASGGGEIIILSTNRIVNHPEEGMEQTEETREWYTKFVFEEGQTVKFSVDTGFSGTSIDPGDEGYGAGWTVAIYDSDGKNRQTWDKIPDDTRGLSLSYSIPKGAFIPSGTNEWRVVLKNTLFDQAETRLFVVDSLEKVPFGTTITMDKTKYKEGDTAHITLEAQANPAGTGEITSFWVIAKWGTPSSTYKFYGPKLLPARQAGGDIYKASFTFDIPDTRPVTMEYLYIRAHAIDSEGRAGPEGEKTPYIEQKVPSTLPPDWIPQVDGDYMLIYILVVIVTVLVGVYIFIMYKQGKLKFKPRKGKK